MIRTATGWIECLAIVLLHAGCGASNDSAPQAAWRGGDSTYVFSEPDDSFTLDKELEEISGLTMMENGLLGATQDENGILYLLDPGSGDIVETREFGKDGDYEGVELGGGRLYILRSDGRIYVFDSWDEDELSGETHDLDLPRGCDAEGIAYQASFDRILISCKERGGKGLDRMKAIFAYDPSAQALSADPVYILDVAAFEASIDEHPINEAVTSIMSDRLDLSGFKPSGLAIHPQTGDVFIISSVTKVIIRMDESGEVTALWELPAKLFDQPEGIAFNADGDLFISSEAGDRKNARLSRFRQRSGQASATPSNH